MVNGWADGRGVLLVERWEDGSGASTVDLKGETTAASSVLRTALETAVRTVGLSAGHLVAQRGEVWAVWRAVQKGRTRAVAKAAW